MFILQFYEDDDAAAIAAKMAAQRGAATKAAQLAVFQAVPQVRRGGGGQASVSHQVDRWTGGQVPLSHQAIPLPPMCFSFSIRCIKHRPLPLAKPSPAAAAIIRDPLLLPTAPTPLLQHAWVAAQLVSQWVGPEGAVDDGAVRRWAPVADVIKEACRWVSTVPHFVHSSATAGECPGCSSSAALIPQAGAFLWL